LVGKDTSRRRRRKDRRRVIISRDSERRLVKMPGLTYPLSRLRYRYNEENARCDLHGICSGFTLIEILIMVVIISIVALTAVPMMSSAASMQIRSAANMITADLEYAKSMAISRGQNFSVVFDENTDSYRIEDQDSNIIAHPVKKGFDYVIDFQNDSRLNKVDITNIDFNSTQRVQFDCLGSPDNAGTISLEAKGTTVRIIVEPVTGFISIE
jgi:prepilin-type N-terminal cleavage/methylation domain-containing protein